MTSKDRRLSKVSSVLSAEERALLVLKAWKEKKEEDPFLRTSMPVEQVDEFNLLIRLMNGVNYSLVPMLVQLEAQIEMLSLRLGWLATIGLWHVYASQLADYIRFETKEPGAQCRRKELEGRALEAYRGGPTRPVVHFDGADMDFGEPSEIDKLVEMYRDILRSGVLEQWRTLGAVNAVVAEAAEEFDGEDPALPEMRQVLDQCKEKLMETHMETQRYTGPFELEEPNNDDLERVREIVEQA